MSLPGEVVYDVPDGRLYRCDAQVWLTALEPGSVDLVVADPPYGTGKAEWDTFESRQEYVSWSREWIGAACRALSPHGTLYVCGYSEVLAEVMAGVSDLFAGCRWLVWFYRNRANLRQDWGRSHESVLHLRKSTRFTMNVDDIRIPYNAHTRRYPQRRQAATSAFSQGGRRRDEWQPHPGGAKPRDVLEIPTLCNGMKEKTAHPTQKPLELISKLILASSHPGETVVDPFAGSGTTLVAARATGRRFLGCERSPDYCRLAAERLDREETSRQELAEQEAARISHRRGLR